MKHIYYKRLEHHLLHIKITIHFLWYPTLVNKRDCKMNLTSSFYTSAQVIIPFFFFQFENQELICELVLAENTSRVFVKNQELPLLSTNVPWSGPRRPVEHLKQYWRPGSPGEVHPTLGSGQTLCRVCGLNSFWVISTWYSLKTMNSHASSLHRISPNLQITKLPQSTYFLTMLIFLYFLNTVLTNKYSLWKRY